MNLAVVSRQIREWMATPLREVFDDDTKYLAEDLKSQTLKHLRPGDAGVEWEPNVGDVLREVEARLRREAQSSREFDELFTERGEEIRAAHARVGHAVDIGSELIENGDDSNAAKNYLLLMRAIHTLTDEKAGHEAKLAAAEIFKQAPSILMLAHACLQGTSSKVESIWDIPDGIDITDLQLALDAIKDRAEPIARGIGGRSRP